jgi:hypothetical protein
VVSTFFGGCGKISAIFFIAFLKPPCYETPKNVIKKIEQKKGGGREKKTEGKKADFFCDEPARWTFWEKKVFRVFEVPLLRNAQKRDKKNMGFPPSVFFPLPRLFCSICFLSRFWAFRNKEHWGVQKQKRDKKVVILFRSRQKKYSLTYVNPPPPP